MPADYELDIRAMWAMLPFVTFSGLSKLSVIFIFVGISALGLLEISFFFFSSRRRHTRCSRDWSSDVCSSDLDFVDLIETDPARRVKLKISHERLAKLHPADIADIVEELAPDEREAVFETLDEQVAAEALEEVHPKVQKAIVESLDSERAADIVEEMEPDAAADLLADLPEERTSEILLEMEPQERKEMVELLEFKENTAAGRMTTEYLALRPDNTAADAVEALRNFGGGVETVSTIYIVDSLGTLIGAVPLARLVLSEPNTPLLALTQEPLISTRAGASEREVAELFDKYNLVTLPVVDENKKLTGVITSDDVISLLRAKL